MSTGSKTPDRRRARPTIVTGGRDPGSRPDADDGAPRRSASDPAARPDQPEDLATALAAVRRALALHARLDPEEADCEAREPRPTAPPTAEVPAAAPSRLVALCRLFDLDPFERDVLVLCAGIELDATIAPLCAEAQVDPRRAYPTFGLALAALPGASWRALLPEAPLRHWQLARLASGAPLTTGELRIDERILHFLLGFDGRDPRLAGLVEPVPPDGELVPSLQRLAGRIASTWRQASEAADFPVVELRGTDILARRAVAAAAAAALDLRLEAMTAEALPTQVDELDELLRLWHREAMLSGAVLLLEGDEARPREPQLAALERFIDRSRSPLIVAHHRWLGPRRRPLLCLEVDKPLTGEQRDLWRLAAGDGDGDAAIGERLEPLVGQFHMSAAEIRGAWVEALGRADAEPGDVSAAVWQACRERVRPAFAGLAERIEPRARWDDLVLPETQLETLGDIVAHVRHRRQVYRDWGFADKSTRDLGISALFAGASGTGKTMAAEVLAGKLDLDLYRIDLAAVVNKYIGETEKNLQRVFDAAESGGAVLLFDEADALFGRRSEVKDSHDRYANIGVSYLLQRMETYKGLAILTTNLLQALDPAFRRRLRFIVEFPFPGPAERRRIWRRIFPPETPTEGLDIARLPRVNLTGGNIRNIAMSAAFRAAEAGRPVAMRDLLIASGRELAKSGRRLPETETRDWLVHRASAELGDGRPPRPRSG